MTMSEFALIQRDPSGGPVIKDTILRRIGDLFTGAFRMHKITIDELTQARLEIERTILKFVFQNAPLDGGGSVFFPRQRLCGLQSHGGSPAPNPHPQGGEIQAQGKDSQGNQRYLGFL